MARQFLTTNYSGLGVQSMHALSELRGDDEQVACDLDNGAAGDAMEWVTVPDHPQQDETFTYTARDVLTSQ